MLCSSLYASCSSSGGGAESNVFISLVHTHTHIIKKKKILYLLYDVRRRKRRVLTYGIRAYSTHDLGSLRLSLT
jgi:hypothetical protein